MKVIVLGGAGDMGRHACRVAASLPSVEQIVVADRAGDAAARLAAQLGHKAGSIALDVSDRVALSAGLAEADVVLNTVGPFFRFGVPILSAAIDARCDYIDICDDWEPTLEMLDLDGAAKAAGVTAVIGLGASPGIVNLLAVLAAGELDDAHRLITGWNMELAQPEPGRAHAASAAVEHGIEQMTGRIRVLSDGRLVDERPLRRMTVDYPGVGRRRVRTFGHPEPVTLGRTITGLRESFNVTHASRSFLAQVVALGWAVDHKLLSVSRAVRLANWAESRVTADPLKAIGDAAQGLPPIFAHATGTRDGRPSNVAATITGVPGISMGEVTGVPLAVGLQLLGEGQITRHGVHAPEAVVDPGRFFDALAGHCPGVKSGESIVFIGRSWDDDPTADYRAAIRVARQRLAVGGAPEAVSRSASTLNA